MPKCQSSKAIGGFLVGPGESSCFPREEILIHDRGLGAEPGDGANPIVGSQLVAPAGLRRNRWFGRPRLAVVTEPEDRMRGVAERCGESGHVNGQFRWDRCDRHSGGGDQGATHRHRRSRGDRTVLDVGRSEVGAGGPQPQPARDRRKVSTRSRVERPVMVEGELDRTRGRCRPGRRPGGCERRHDHRDMIPIRQERARRNQPADAAARRILFDVRASSGLRQRMRIEHRWLQAHHFSRHLDLVRCSDEKNQPGAQRLPLRQRHRVAPRQIGSAELRVHGLVDLDVPCAG